MNHLGNNLSFEAQKESFLGSEGGALGPWDLLLTLDPTHVVRTWTSTCFCTRTQYRKAPQQNCVHIALANNVTACQTNETRKEVSGSGGCGNSHRD